MDSDSLNEISNESLMDDVNPLFLRVDCKISSNGRVAKCSLHLIPTCICTLNLNRHLVLYRVWSKMKFMAIFFRI